jgi:simple sugar transport system permease protein
VAALPWGLSFLLPMLAAALAGALWGGLAGYLKAWRGTNEVIATLLLSFIATWMVYGAVQSEALLRQPMTSAATLPESLPIPESTQIPLLTGDYGMPLHAGLLLGLVLMVVVGVVLRYTVLGCSCMPVGLNPRAARRAGLPVRRLVVGPWWPRARWAAGRGLHAAGRAVLAQGRLLVRLWL